MTSHHDSTRWERLKAFLFHLFPHHWISRVTYYLARLETPLKNPLISAYIRFFKVDMEEAEFSKPDHYLSFNHFFTRALKPGVHNIHDDPEALISPCDGKITQIGEINQASTLQAKGRYYGVEELLGGETPGARELAKPFTDGKACSIYLSPRDYHRVHAPADVRLKAMVHIPGRLFSVTDYALRTIPSLYLRNERVVCIFESSLGALAVVMVGALNVGSIETTWSGLVTPTTFVATRTDYLQAHSAPEVCLKRGEEMGRFNMGSCVIVLTSNPKLVWNPLYAAEKRIRMGEELGCLIDKNKRGEEESPKASFPLADSD